MLNVGPLELLVVLAVALIVVGPERLPELARSVGRALRQFREVQDEVRNMVSTGVDDEIRDAAAEFRKVTGGITRATDVKGAARRADRSIRNEVAASPKKPAKGSVNETGEAAGPPADGLEDTAAERETSAQPLEPAEPADRGEPETPPQP